MHAGRPIQRHEKECRSEQAKDKLRGTRGRLHQELPHPRRAALGDGDEAAVREGAAGRDRRPRAHRAGGEGQGVGDRRTAPQVQGRRAAGERAVGGRDPHHSPRQAHPQHLRRRGDRPGVHQGRQRRGAAERSRWPKRRPARLVPGGVPDEAVVDPEGADQHGAAVPARAHRREPHPAQVTGDGHEAAAQPRGHGAEEGRGRQHSPHEEGQDP
mmetsp:Transcript_46545/g.110249  ORF Transcript_46545/g.110249 Transcript_46545/m.110249 type:complete len:213 (-) Transcript_46545:88-726(-)